MQRRGGLHAVDAQLAQRARRARERGRPAFVVHDQLREQRIVERRHRVARIEQRIDSNAGARGPDERIDAAGVGPEILQRVLRVDPAFERGAAQCDVALREAQRLAVRDAQHLAHEIDARDRLRHRMLDLDARVHLDEVELAARVVEQILERARAAIAHLPRETRRRCAQRIAQRGRERRRRRFLENLLAPPLQRAFAFEQMNNVLAVAQDLHFDVPRARDEAFEIDAAVAERGLCLALRER
ncbi:Uncharacterised protein [Burkholderia pseudomallei]|nr:Uncharacterised protein [Burkholderia pseudomallei]